METFLYLFVHYGLITILIAYILFKKFKSNTGLFTTTALGITWSFYMYLWGQWPIIGSYYMRYAMIVAIGLFLYMFWTKRKKIYRHPLKMFAHLRTFLTGLLALYMAFICIQVLLTNTNYSTEAVSMSFPLKGGEYYISSGGANKKMNNHMRVVPSAQQYAIDINKLEGFKSVSAKILSKTNEDHYIFSDTIYAPCDGLVLETKNNVIDNPGSTMNVSREDGEGNYVYLQCKDIYVFIPHFKQYSVFVTKDERVIVGQPLGLVGNSGFSQEPHVHLQAARYSADSTLVGVPIRFNGEILSRNNIYSN